MISPIPTPDIININLGVFKKWIIPLVIIIALLIIFYWIKIFKKNQSNAASNITLIKKRKEMENI